MRKVQLFSEVVHWVDNKRFKEIETAFKDQKFNFFSREEELSHESMEFKLRERIREEFWDKAERGTLTTSEQKFLIDYFCGRRNDFWVEKDNKFDGMK